MNRYDKAVSQLVKTDLKYGIGSKLNLSYGYVKKNILIQLKEKKWSIKQIKYAIKIMKSEEVQELQKNFFKDKNIKTI